MRSDRLNRIAAVAVFAFGLLSILANALERLIAAVRLQVPTLELRELELLAERKRLTPDQRAGLACVYCHGGGVLMRVGDGCPFTRHERCGSRRALWSVLEDAERSVADVRHQVREQLEEIGGAASELLERAPQDRAIAEWFAWCEREKARTETHRARLIAQADAPESTTADRMYRSRELSRCYGRTWALSDAETRLRRALGDWSTAPITEAPPPEPYVDTGIALDLAHLSVGCLVAEVQGVLTSMQPATERVQVYMSDATREALSVRRFGIELSTAWGPERRPATLELCRNDALRVGTLRIVWPPLVSLATLAQGHVARAVGRPSTDAGDGAERPSTDAGDGAEESICPVCGNVRDEIGTCSECLAQTDGGSDV